MSRVHFEYMANRGYAEFIFVRQIETVQAIDAPVELSHHPPVSAALFFAAE